MEHDLKIWPKFFQQVRNEEKLFEIRSMDDRGYKVGDSLLLREYEPEKQEYSGRYVQVQVMQITTADEYPAGLQEGYCSMSIRMFGYGDHYQPDPNPMEATEENQLPPPPALSVTDNRGK